jgi:hypothetical protein
MAVLLVLLGVLAGVIAAKAVKRGSPPVPSMAIEEARKIRDAVGPDGAAPGGAAAARAGAVEPPPIVHAPPTGEGGS